MAIVVTRQPQAHAEDPALQIKPRDLSELMLEMSFKFNFKEILREGAVTNITWCLLSPTRRQMKVMQHELGLKVGLWEGGSLKHLCHMT